MNVPNKKYWTDRAVQLEQVIQENAEPTIKAIQDAYLEAVKQINEDIKAVVRGLSKASVITEDAAEKLLNKAQSRQQYKDLIRLYDETENERAKKDIALKINRQAYGARMTRIEALKQNVYNHLMHAQNKEMEQHKTLHAETLQHSYYSNIHNIAKGFDVGINFSILPKKAIDKALSAKWLGSNYSRRIWNNNQQFIEKVQRTITDGITAGHSIDRMANKLLDYVSVEGTGQRYITERLVRTETAHFMAEGQLEAYKETGIEKYQYVASLAENTCIDCGNLDGETFNISEARAGDNYPPLHANCRCTTVLAGYSSNTRIARAPVTSKNYKVDGNMTFNEWKNSLTDEQRSAIKYVDKSAVNDIIKSNNVETAVSDVHYIGKLDKNIYQCVTKDIRTDDVIITDERIEHIKERHPNDYERYCSYIPQIIKNPDYIIEANKSNTAVILKEIYQNNEKFKLVLRLKVENDPETYKNSVISFWEIGDTTWRKTIKNKKILYKNE